MRFGAGKPFVYTRTANRFEEHGKDLHVNTVAIWVYSDVLRPTEPTGVEVYLDSVDEANHRPMGAAERTIFGDAAPNAASTGAGFRDAHLSRQSNACGASGWSFADVITCCRSLRRPG